MKPTIASERDYGNTEGSFPIEGTKDILRNMTKRQQEFVIGKLLGDGSLENRGTAHSRLQIRHSIHQKEYVDWCYRQIREFVPSAPKQHKDSYYFRTRSLPMFTKIRRSEERRVGKECRL